MDIGAALRAIGHKPVSYTHLDVYKRQHVWCTTSNFYQESMSLGTFIMDVYKMLTEGEAADTAYMYLLK